MVKKKKSKDPQGTISADFGLGGLFKGIEDILQMASKAAESGGEASKTGEFNIPGLGDKAKGIFGFSIKTLGQDGIKVEPFGNVRETKAGPVVEEIREPIVDVFDEEDQLQVLAEMPGVEKKNIKYSVTGDILILDAEGPRQYHKEVLLPAAVKEEDAKASYMNGIYELRFTKA